MSIFNQKNKLKAAFDKIKREFNDHLDAINANTNEIQVNHEQLCGLEMRVDRLNERIDETNMILSNILEALNIQGCNRTRILRGSKRYEVMELTGKEKEIFLTIYDLEERGFTTYEDIAKKSSYPRQLVIGYITNLIAKGVPIIKRPYKNSSKLNIEKGFKEEQAKRNILDIDEQITQKVRDNAF